jgi:hypothetical protein
MTDESNAHARRTLAMLRQADEQGIDGADERVRELEADLEGCEDDG